MPSSAVSPPLEDHLVTASDSSDPGNITGLQHSDEPAEIAYAAQVNGSVAQGTNGDDTGNRLSPERAWKECNLLTFDGGGIRGYWSLLVMKQLMDHIASIEMNHELGKNAHSFHPHEYPEEVSQIAYLEAERRADRTTLRADDKEWLDPELLDPARRYLPCHYFDYIGGTSTGALIAILLGRLRMTVLDCLQEYARIGSDIFGDRDAFAKIRMIFTKGTKYPTGPMEQAFKKVVERRREHIDQDEFDTHVPSFPSPKGMCHTFATTLVTSTKSLRNTPYILRSYKATVHRHSLPAGPTERRPRFSVFHTALPTGQAETQEQRLRRNQEPHKMKIWEVARAATAAPKYFKPYEIETLGGGKVQFEDAGLRVPNPTAQGMEQIESKHGPNSCGVVVSLGTAKGSKERQIGSQNILRTGEQAVQDATDPDWVHDQTAQRCERAEIPYFRFNPKPSQRKHLLEIPFDAWEPRKAHGNEQSGSRTLELMATRFDEWYKSDLKNNAAMFRNCASELVERRRQRMQDGSRWERYILGSFYPCLEEECCKWDRQRRFTDRDGFRSHWRSEHQPHAGNPEAQLERRIEQWQDREWKYQKREKEPSQVIERYS